MRALRPPYRKLLARQGQLGIWRVDGHRVRDTIDVEFTNGAHCFTRRYVPEDEIWLDRDAPGSGEWRFWAAQQLVERAAMARGASYLRALAAGNRADRAARVQAAAERPLRRRRLGRASDHAIWLVDGAQVRAAREINFTLGGHRLRYRFIPSGEIWIDDAVAPAERPAIVHHEAIEIAHMQRGLRYDEAHALASRAELRFRRGARRARL
jgi:hypothetical protein